MFKQKNWLLSFAILAASCSPSDHRSPFVKVQGTRLVRDGKPYLFMGANYWQGMNLGSP